MKNLVLLLCVLLIVIGAWYWYASSHKPQLPGSATTVQVGPALSTGNTTTDLQNDLNNTPSPDAANQEMNTLNGSVRAF